MRSKGLFDELIRAYCIGMAPYRVRERLKQQDIQHK